jgi:DNA-binding transcriptional MerR regulator
MTTSEKLIGSREVAQILNISLPSLRDYRKRGLIIVAAKRGNSDLYDKTDVLRRYVFIQEKRKQGFSLSQISVMLKNEPGNLVNLPGPSRPTPEMSNQELLHGFLSELYLRSSLETKAYIDELSQKWNILFRKKNEKANK